MAASIVIEEERGTYTRSPHPHNGYYAGDFGRTSSTPSSRTFAPRPLLTFTSN